MLPDFGVGLRSFLFENFTPAVLTSISDEIRSQVASYMPFVNVRRITFADSESNPDTIAENELRISIVYDILPLDDTDTLTITEVTS
jgi:phage baseplate assembly protein W